MYNNSRNTNETLIKQSIQIIARVRFSDFPFSTWIIIRGKNWESLEAQTAVLPGKFGRYLERNFHNWRNLWLTFQESNFWYNCRIPHETEALFF